MNYASYTNAALRGMGGFDSYTDAALRGMGDFDSYTNAALRGMGDCDCGSSYTNAALRGMGKPKRLVKGSKEAKAYMARLRAMRGKGCRGGKLAFEPPSDFSLTNNTLRGERLRKLMRQIAEQKKKKRQMEGSGPVGKIITNSLKFWGDYGKSWKDSRKAQIDELERLRKLKKERGGKFELQDLRDGFLGPIGWIRMGLRKKRQREIERLKKELGEA